MLKKPLTHVFFLVVILVVAFFFSIFFINQKLLVIYKKKYYPFFQEMLASYDDINYQNKDDFLPTLKKINLKNIESHSDHHPISFFYQYDNSWQLLISHSMETSSKHHIRIMNQKIIKSIQNKDVNFLDLGQQLLLKFNHDENLFPLKYTIVTVQDREFFEQKNFLSLMVIVFFFISSTPFFVLFLFPWKNKVPKKIKIKEKFNEPLTDQNKNKKNDLKIEIKKESKESFQKEKAIFVDSDDSKIESTKENFDSPIRVNINTDVEEKIRSFDEIFKYKQQLENQIEKLAIVREVKLAFQYATNVDDSLSAIVSLIHSKIPGNKIEIFLNETAHSEFLMNSSFLTLRCSVENDQVVRYSPRDEAGPKLMLNLGEEGRALSHFHGIILNEKSQSTLTVPIVEGNNIIGAIRLKSSQIGLYGHEEKFIMEKLANHIAKYLNHIHFHQLTTS